MFENMIGKRVNAVILDQSKDLITFHLEDKLVTFTTKGDCCSHSWIEHLEMPEDILGATILSIDEPELNPWDNHTCAERKSYDDPEYCHDVLQVYHTRFRTDRGDIMLEYRNDSNGYYGGYLVEI